MPRNMSFTLTTKQVRNKIKSVTRRLGWEFLKVGDVLNACEKCQGLKKGEKIKKICQIRVVDISREPLLYITDFDLRNEGFPGLTTDKFVDFFCKHNKCHFSTMVNRIQFEYLD